MSLRHVIPALAVAAGILPLSAADIGGGITLGGFVDAIGAASNTTDDGASTAYNFSAATELRFGAKIDDKVSIQIDAEWNNTNTTGNHGDTYLEQAFVKWAFSKEASVVLGKYTSYAGWVAADPDGLYRVGGGPIPGRFYGTELLGPALNYSPSAAFGVSVFLTNGLGLLNTNAAYGNTTTDDSSFLSPAVDAVFKADGVGTFNVELGYDYEGADAQDVIAFGANATLNFKGVEALTLGFEVLYQAYGESDAGGDDHSRMAGLAMANYKFLGAPKPMSGTLMAQYIAATDYDLGANAISTGNDSTILEVAAALLTNPTGSANFGLNFELAYQTLDSDALDDTVDSVSAAIEMLALIP